MITTPLSPPHHHARSIREHLTKFGQTLQVAYEVKEDSTVISMVRRGLGASIMARLTAEPIPSEIQVCHLPVPLYRIIGVITLKEALLSRAIFAFLDLLKALVPTHSPE